MSDAFQVEMERRDCERGLWWGNQVVGRALRHAGEPDRWAAVGRDEIPLPDHSAEGADRFYVSAEAALIRVRDAWRQRAVTVSEVFGEDYWIEPRHAAGVESLWLGRIHLGYIRPCTDGTYEAFTTNDDRIEPRAVGTRTHPTREEGLLAVRGAWRTHLRRILRVQPPHSPR
ncbi:hypothetical protein [Actinomadura miaoliensis]|uniref:hypothetical protein n=1 Tax=Actinomadura miaoliensis TaxID=430685 RepID=UPI0031EFB977